MPTTDANAELWRTIFALGHPALKSRQRRHRALPTDPRCKLCFAPFRGIGGLVVGLLGYGPSHRNPRFCSRCDKFLRQFPGGAEVELSLLFADVRGSTQLAERLSPTEFTAVMRRFYAAATQVLTDSDGFLIDLVGDEVVAIYPPGFSGPDHARKAFAAARALTSTTIATTDGSTLGIGIGVHTGVAFVGTVGQGASAGAEDVRALGDAVNTVARLASAAAAGEALVSDAAIAAAHIDPALLEPRTLTLKGKSQPIGVGVYSAARAASNK